MSRENLRGVIVGCIIAVIGVVGIAMSGEMSTSPEPEPTAAYTLSVSVSPSGAGGSLLQVANMSPARR